MGNARFLDLIARVSHYTGICQLFQRLNRRRKKILVYHNVLQDEHYSGALHEGVSHSLSVFRHHMAYLAANYRFSTDLDDRESITITVDDGYLNQSTLIHPVLEHHGIRAYFFFALQLLREGQALSIDRLLYWLSYVPAGNYALGTGADQCLIEFHIATDLDRRDAWRRIAAMLARGVTTESQVETAMDTCHRFEDIYALRCPEALALRLLPVPLVDCDRMKSFGHLIGAHSVTHRALSRLPGNEMEEEVEDCAREIGVLFNTAVFCYPFGGPDDVNETVAARVAAAGFSAAFANTNVPLDDSAVFYGQYCIPRIALPNRAEPHVLSFVLSGTRYFLKHGRLFPRWNC